MLPLARIVWAPIVVRGRRKPSALPGADTPPGAVIVNPRFTDVASLKAEHWENP